MTDHRDELMQQAFIEGVLDVVKRSEKNHLNSRNSFSIKPMSDLLGQQQKFNRLLPQTKLLSKIQAQLSTLLSGEIAKHCRAESLHNGCLILSVPSSAWATPLRYQTSDILALLRQQSEFASIASIKVQIKLPERQESTQKQTKPALAPLSKSAAMTIQTTAESISDPKLRAALLKLAKHTHE